MKNVPYLIILWQFQRTTSKTGIWQMAQFFHLSTFHLHRRHPWTKKRCWTIITDRTRTTSLPVSEINNAIIGLYDNIDWWLTVIVCFQGLIHNREKQEIKTVRIVKRESERRQRDRGDRTGNIGIPLTNGLQAPGGAKRLCDDDLGGSQKFEVISSNLVHHLYLFHLFIFLHSILVNAINLFLFSKMLKKSIFKNLEDKCSISKMIKISIILYIL